MNKKVSTTSNECERIIAEQEADALHRLTVMSELDKMMRRSFEDKCREQGKFIHFAAISIARARWSDIVRDVQRGKYSAEKAGEIYQLAVSYKVVTPAFAKLQGELLSNI